MKLRTISFGALAFALCMCLFVADASAATLTWNGNTNSNLNTATNWTPNGTPANGDTLVFPAGPANQNLNNDIGANTDLILQFTGGAYTIAGNEMDMNGTWTVTGGGPHILNFVVDSNGGNNFNIGAGLTLTIGTAGTINANNDNVTILGGGTLTIADGTSMDDGLDLFIDGGATVDLGGFSETVGTFTLINGTLSNGTLTAGAAYDLRAGTVNAVLAGGVGVNKTTAGTVVLTNANTYTGATNVNAGILQIRHADALGTTAGGTTVATGAELQLNSVAGITFAAEPLTLNGNGVGGTSGALRKMNSTTTDTWQGTIALNSSSTIWVDGNNDRLHLNGVISGAGGSTLTRSGSALGGQVFFNAANTYDGATIINRGDVALQGVGTLGSTAAGTTVNSGGSVSLYGVTITGEALTLTGDGYIGDGALVSFSASSTWAGTITLAGNARIGNPTAATTLTISGGIGTAGNTLTVDGPGDSNITTAAISGTGAVTKVSTGTLTYSFANTYTGLTTVSEGSLTYGVNNAISTGAVTVAGGTLDIVTFNDSVGTVTLNGGTITGTTGVLTSTASFEMQNGSAAAIMGGAVPLNKTTAGSVTLSKANTYTGLTTVSAGTLTYGIDDAIATGAVTVSGGTLDIVTFNDSVGTVTLSGGATITGTTGVLTSTGTFEMQSGSAAAIMAGAVPLNKTTAGAVTLSKANTYTGLTTVSAGTLTYGINDAIATGAVTVSGGTLDLVTFNDTVGTVTLSGGATITGTTGVLSTTGTFEVQDGTASAILGGAAAMNKTTGGTVTLTRNNTFTGNVTLSGGTLVIGADNNLGNAANDIIFGAAATLQFSANVPLNAGRDVTLTGNGTFDTQNNQATINGVVSGAGELIKVGNTGILTITNTNTYTGITRVQQGRVIAQNTAAFGAAAAGTLVSANATVDANAAGTFSEPFTIAGPGTAPGIGALRNGDFAVVLDGGITLTGNANIQVDGGGASSLTIQTNPIVATGFGLTVEVLTNRTGTITSAIQGNGATTLTKIGTGSLVLSGTNTYTGATNINVGTLLLGASNVIADASNVVVREGAMFDLQGNSDQIGTLTMFTGGAAGGGPRIQGTAAAVLTLGGNFTIDTTNNGDRAALINGFTLDLGGANRTLSVPDSTGDTIELHIDAIIQNGGVIKTGAGVLHLTRANTFANDLRIDAGTVELQTGNNVADTTDVNMNGATAVLRVLNNETIRDLKGAQGSVVLTGANTLTLDQAANQTVGAVISGSGNLVKNNNFDLVLTANNTFTGTTTANAGRLVVNGNYASAITLNNAATLAGTGTSTASVTGNNTATVAPGALAATGILATGSVNIGGGGRNFDITINGITGGANVAGTHYDQLNVTGTVDITGATLNLTFVANSRGGDTLVLINNDGADAVTGQFAGLAEGAPITNGAFTYNISYVGGSGNDVTLTRQPQTWIWDGGGGTANWSDFNNWNGTLATDIPSTNDIVVFPAGAAQLPNNNDLIGLILTGIQFTGAGGGYVISGNGVQLNNGSVQGLNTAGSNTLGINITNSVVPAGTGSVVMNGAGGTLVLSGTNTYTGSTTVTAGTLQVSGGAAIANGNSVIVNGGVFELLAAETIGDLSGTGGTVALGTSVLTVTQANNLTYSGVFTGTGGAGNAGLIKQGAGTLTLNTNNALVNTIDLTVAAGTLDLGTVSHAVENFTMTGGTLSNGTLTSTTNYAVQAGNVSAVLAVNGGVGLDKTTGGTVILSGANTYTGTTTIGAGTLQLGAANVIADASPVNITGGTLDLNNFNETIGSLAGVGGTSVTLGTGNLTVGGLGSNTNYGGVISGSGNVTKIGTGQFGLNGANTFTGTLFISNGQIVVGNASALGGTAGATVLNPGAGINATLRLAGFNIGTEPITFNAAGGTATVLESFNGVNSVVGGTVTMTSPGVFQVDFAASTLTVNGQITGAGALTKFNSAGVLVLTNNTNDYTGATNVNGGTLRVTAANALGGTGAGTNVNNASTVELNGTFTLAAEPITLNSTGTPALSLTSGAVSVPGPVTLAQTAQVATTAGTALTISGNIGQSAASGLNKVATGTLTLSGNNSYTGVTDIQAGTLEADSNTALGASGALQGTTVQAGATLLLNAGVNIPEPLTINGTGVGANGAIQSAAADNTLSGSVVLGSDSSIGVASNVLTISGAISGGFNLTKVGASTLTLTGNNSWGGTTTVSAGTLLDNSGADAIPNGSAVTVANGATLTIDNNDETIGSLAGVAGSSVSIINNAILRTGGNNAPSTTFDGVISGNGLGLAKEGTGLFTLGGNNSFTGEYNVLGGTLATSANERLANSVVVVINNGATFDIGTNTETIDRLQLTSGIVNSAGGSLTATTAYDVSSGTINANLVGGGPLNKLTNGTVVLNGTNTYGGATNINAGTLEVNNGSAVPDTSAVIIAAAGILDANGVIETIGELSGSGQVSLGAGTLTVNEVNPTTFSGVISGAGGNLNKTGAATLTLSGANTFTGTLTVQNASTVVLNNNNVLADAASVNLSAAGATLTLANAFTDTIAALDGAAGSVVNIATGNLTIGFGDTGGTFLGSLGSGTGTLTKVGTATWTNGGTVNIGALAINAGTINNNNAITVAGAITGGATLVQNNAAATLTIGGTGHAVLLDAALAGNTVTYNGANQTLITPTTSYSDLVLAGTGNKDTAAGFSIGDDLDIQANVTFNVGNFSYNLAGDMTVSGTFNPQTSTFTLNGTATQVLTDLTANDRIDFNNLTVNNSVASNIAVSLAVDTDLRVAGNLVLQDGSINVGTGGNIVDLTSTGAAATTFNRTGSGHIYSTAGTAAAGVVVVQKAFAAAANQSIIFHVGSDPDNYTPAELTELDFTGSGAGTLTAGTTPFVRNTAIGTNLPTDGGLTRAITRYWTINSNGLTLAANTSYRALFTFVAGDLNGTTPGDAVNDEIFVVRRLSAANWFTTSRDLSTNTTVRASSINSFSDFQPGEDDGINNNNLPRITNVVMVSSTVFDVTISEDVFTNNGTPPNGALTPADFRVVINSQAVAAPPTGRVTQADTTITSVVLQNAPPLAPVYRITVDYGTFGATGVSTTELLPRTPAGVETIQIQPANGNTIFDTASNAMADPQAASPVISLPDETSPYVVSVTAPQGPNADLPAASVYNAYREGNAITFTVTFSEQVQFRNTNARLVIRMGDGTTRQAVPVGGTPLNTFQTTYQFTYTVAVGDYGVDIDYDSANPFLVTAVSNATGTGDIEDATGNDFAAANTNAGLSLPRPLAQTQAPTPGAPGQTGSLSQTSTVHIDATNPVFTTPPPDVTTAEDTAVEVQFVINDNILDTLRPGSMRATAVSNNQGLIRDADIQFIAPVPAGADNRRLLITPVANANGTATITVTIRDGFDHITVDTFLVTVTPVNDPPVITQANPAGVVNFTENGAAVAIEPATTISDIDALTTIVQDLATPGSFPASLTVTLSNGEDFDRLSVGASGNLTVSIGGQTNNIVNGTLFFNNGGGPVQIGTFSTAESAGAFANGDPALQPPAPGFITTVEYRPVTLTLTVSFDFTASGFASDVAYTAAQAVVQNVTYQSASERPTTYPRTATFVLNDGGPANTTSNSISRTIQVTEVNDVPAISIVAGTNGNEGTGGARGLPDMSFNDRTPTGFTQVNTAETTVPANSTDQIARVVLPDSGGTPSPVTFVAEAIDADDNLDFTWIFLRGGVEVGRTNALGDFGSVNGQRLGTVTSYQTNTPGAPYPRPNPVFAAGQPATAFVVRNTTVITFSAAGTYTVRVEVNDLRGGVDNDPVSTATYEHGAGGVKEIEQTSTLTVNTPPRIDPNPTQPPSAEPPNGNIAVVSNGGIINQGSATVFVIGLLGTLGKDQDGQILQYQLNMGDFITTNAVITVTQNGSEFTVTSSDPNVEVKLLNNNQLEVTYTYRILDNVTNSGRAEFDVVFTILDQQTDRAGNPVFTQSTYHGTIDNAIVGAAADLDVFNPVPSSNHLGITSTTARSGLITFFVVNVRKNGKAAIKVHAPGKTAKDVRLELVKADILGQTFTTRDTKDAQGVITAAATEAGTAYRGSLNFNTADLGAGIYVIEATDTVAGEPTHTVRKLFAVTQAVLGTVATSREPAVQDVNVATSFVTAKLRFNSEQPDLLTFRARFPYVDTLQREARLIGANPEPGKYDFQATKVVGSTSVNGATRDVVAYHKDLSFKIGIGNLVVYAETDAEGKPSATAIYDHTGKLIVSGAEAKKAAKMRFKLPSAKQRPDYISREETDLNLKKKNADAGLPQRPNLQPITNAQPKDQPNDIYPFAAPLPQFQAVLDISISLQNIDVLGGLDTEGVTQEYGNLGGGSVFVPVDNKQNRAQEDLRAKRSTQSLTEVQSLKDQSNDYRDMPDSPTVPSATQRPDSRIQFLSYADQSKAAFNGDMQIYQYFRQIGPGDLKPLGIQALLFIDNKRGE
ncbi:MAG TPA: autotransporter-associated beta strand repeat-containing protein, partial [Planctomycetota bacterium]|nr:autotransporter-associated beta strand repeat-containing protein [Planctomycetota bacterium]